MSVFKHKHFEFNEIQISFKFLLSDSKSMQSTLILSVFDCCILVAVCFPLTTLFHHRYSDTSSLFSEAKYGKCCNYSALSLMPKFKTVGLENG